MNAHIFHNKLELIYKKCDSPLTSICISLGAGATVDGSLYGLAHATEHMVFKGTRNRSEKEINRALNNIFGFHNAMTNYPYVIYYGNCLSEDFKEGAEIFSDILIQPTFPQDGFKEEMAVIQEELKEWDEALDQYCEDHLFAHCFKTRRLKLPIIGTEESLQSISLENVKNFYQKYYGPANTSICVISSLEFEEVKSNIETYFGCWSNDVAIENETDLDDFYPGTFIDYKAGIQTSRVQMIFPIHKLNHQKLKALQIFNGYFGEGVNSLLYDTLRTQKGLVYDVSTSIAFEAPFKFYKITFNTASEHVEEAIRLVNQSINKLGSIKKDFDPQNVKQLIKNYLIKRLFREEKSIILAKELSTYSTMFGDFQSYLDEIRNLDQLDHELIFSSGIQVLNNPAIQIIKKVR